jgi:WD40 repeat protein
MIYKAILFACTIICLSTSTEVNAIVASECTPSDDYILCESINISNAEQVVRVGTLGWGSISDITWLPNSDVLVVATGVGIWLYSSLLDINPNLAVVQNGVTSVDYDVNENLLLSTSFDRSITLWDIDSGQVLHRLNQHLGTTNQAKFIEQGTSIISVSNDGTIMIWNIESESLTFVSQIDNVSAVAVDYSSNASIIAVANSIDGSVILIDAETKTIISTIDSQEQSEDIRALAFNPIGTILASAGGDGVVIWSRNNATLAAENYPFMGAVNAVEFSSDGSMMVYGDTSGRVYIWNLEENTVEIVMELGVWITDVSFRSDNSRLAVATIDGRVTLWNTDDNSLVISTRFGHGLSVNDAVFNSNGNFLVSGGDDRVTRLWDVLSETEVASFEGNSSVDVVLFSPETEHLIASGNSDGTISLWDTTSGTLVTEFGHSDVVEQDISFDPTGEFLVSVNNGITLWSVENGTSLMNIDVDTEWPINTVVYSPSGDAIAFSTIGTGTIYLWHPFGDSAEPIILGQHESLVSAIAFSPSGSLLVSGGQNILKLWDLETLQLIQTINQDLGEIADVDFSSDGSLLAFATGDSLRIVNIENQAEIISIEANFGGIRSVDFNSNDTLIATAGNDGTIQLWGVP